jgi:Flp pilus assembly pilin Flp
MALAHAVGMSNVRKRLLENTNGTGFIQHVLVTTAVAIGLVGAITSQQTVLNAKIASITSSVAIRTQCRPDVRIENSQAPAPRCAR